MLKLRLEPQDKIIHGIKYKLSAEFKRTQQSQKMVLQRQTGEGKTPGQGLTAGSDHSSSWLLLYTVINTKRRSKSFQQATQMEHHKRDFLSLWTPKYLLDLTIILSGNN